MPTAALYDLADRFYKLAPWNWMHEERIIFIKHPKTGEQAFLSVMGGNGEHHSLAIYLGEESLQRFNLIHEADYEGIELGHTDHMPLILESRQIQASFELRNEIEPHEYKEIKSLGRSYRGGNWPSFRSFRPGYAPGPIDADEEEWLTLAIEQLLEVAPLLDEDPFAEYRSGDSGTEWITREIVDGEWATTWTKRDMTLFQFFEPEPSELLTAKVKRHRAIGTIEVLHEILPMPIGDDPRNRAFPYLLMSADSESGFVLGSDLASVEKMPHRDLIESVPDTFLKCCDQHGVCPSEIHVPSRTAEALLRKTAKALDVPLVFKESLPALDEAFGSMMSSPGMGH